MTGDDEADIAVERCRGRQDDRHLVDAEVVRGRESGEPRDHEDNAEDSTTIRGQDLCAGFVYSQILAACVQVRLFDILAEGPRTVAALAPRLGLPPDGAQRLLDAAAALRLVARRRGGRASGRRRATTAGGCCWSPIHP